MSIWETVKSWFNDEVPEATPLESLSHLIIKQGKEREETNRLRRGKSQFIHYRIATASYIASYSPTATVAEVADRTDRLIEALGYSEQSFIEVESIY